MKETDLIEDRALRDSCVTRYDVLEKVKELFLIPEMECMTVEQVADYYSTKDYEDPSKNVIVTTDGLRKLYSLYKEELDGDGTCIKSYKDFLIGNKFTLEDTLRGKVLLRHDRADKTPYLIEIPNRGIRIFPRRAILRVGMLLRDSVVARSVRDQLLNIEEKVDNETKTADINEEQKLMLSVGMAYASGDINAMLKATTEYNAFQNRHIEALEADNGKLVADNKALAEGNLEWSDRSQINYAIRRLSGLSGVTVQKLWGDLYNQLLYKFHMNVRARGKQPWIQHVEEHEWNCVNKVFSSMCNSYGLSASEILEGIKVK